VLLDAARMLRQRLRRSRSDLAPRIVIHGSMAGSPEFQSRLAEKLAAMGDMVEYRGAYDMGEVVDLMSAAGWIVVPSTWWENSPVVIEEAFHAGRPVICGNIGGMKEKVAHEVNGLHFRARDPADLSATLERCLREPELWARLKASVREVPSLPASAAAHRACYGAIGHG
jgi:glycosyltransferase involved in cell wall biosynthesis